MTIFPDVPTQVDADGVRWLRSCWYHPDARAGRYVDSLDKFKIALRVVGFFADSHSVHDDNHQDDAVFLVDNETVAVCMHGDDYIWFVNARDLMELDETDYCAVCGQCGCTHDGRADEEEVDDEL